MRTMTPRVVFFSILGLQDRYRKQAADERVQRLVKRQIHLMCADSVPGRLGHARWVARELLTVKALLCA